MASNRKRATNSVGNKIGSIDSKVARNEKATQAPHLDENGIVAEHLADGAVSERALEAGSVTDEKLARGAVGTEHLGVVNRITSDSNLFLSSGPGFVMLEGQEYAATPPAGTVYSLAADSEGRIVITNIEPGESTGAPDYRIPVKPQNLEGSSVGGWTHTGEGTSAVLLSWDATTTDTSGNPIEIATYEVFYVDSTELSGSDPLETQLLATTEGTSIVISPMEPGRTLFLKVRARSTDGVAGAFSGAITVTTLRPSMGLAAPSAPTVFSTAGTVLVSWDGLLTDGAPPTYFGYVYAAVSSSENGTYRPVGSPLLSVGTVSSSGEPDGATRWYRLYAVDSQGEISAGSAAVSVVIKAAALDTALSDLVQEVSDQGKDIESVRLSADGKNSIYRQAGTPPGTSYKINDTWFDTDDGGKMYTWDGAAWQPIEFGAGAISDTITDAIANAQNAASGALTAANGKNRVWYQNEMPPLVGNTVGDTWFDSNDGNIIYSWDGTAWTDNPFGAGAIVDGAIDYTKLSDGVNTDITSSKTRLNTAEGILASLKDSMDAVDIDLGELNTELGQAVKSTVEEYTSHTSETVPPASGATWSTTLPPKAEGKYNWRRTKTIRVNGTISYSPPVLVSGVDGDDAVLLRISSSRGTSFKNSNISTVLTATVYVGAKQIVNLAGLQAEFGMSAYLEWWWRRVDDTDFGVISSADTRISQGGFAFTVSPADVDEQTVFQCILHNA